MVTIGVVPTYSGVSKYRSAASSNCYTYSKLGGGYTSTDRSDTSSSQT